MDKIVCQAFLAVDWKFFPVTHFLHKNFHFAKLEWIYKKWNNMSHVIHYKFFALNLFCYSKSDQKDQNKNACLLIAIWPVFLGLIEAQFNHEKILASNLCEWKGKLSTKIRRIIEKKLFKIVYSKTHVTNDKVVTLNVWKIFIFSLLFVTEFSTDLKLQLSWITENCECHKNRVQFPANFNE